MMSSPIGAVGGPETAGGGTPASALVRLRDLVEWPGSGIRIVDEAGGLDRPVRLVHPTELVDPSPFLRGGELILTVGGELSSESACREFVEALVRRSAVGIGLAVDVPGYRPPAHLAAAAARVGLPLFTVPTTLPFIAFTERFEAIRSASSQWDQERREDGRMLDFIRRGLASPWVLRDRLAEAEERGEELATLTVPLGEHVVLDGAVVEGWTSEGVVLVAESGAVERFEQSRPGIVYATGSSVPLAGLARSLKECAAAFSIAARRDRPAGPRDLATLSGLVERLTADQLAPFRDHALVPLQQHDARHGTHLVDTLAAYFAHGASVPETATALFLHVNSVRNRLARIRQVTGLDPAAFDDRLVLTLALESVRGRSG
ncbi:MAG: PucR family transcriptional regulator [Microbacteriaceae bacterium]